MQNGVESVDHRWQEAGRRVRGAQIANPVDPREEASPSSVLQTLHFITTHERIFLILHQYLRRVKHLPLSLQNQIIKKPPPCLGGWGTRFLTRS
jgi:hypothetical protein